MELFLLKERLNQIQIKFLKKVSLQTPFVT